jgi:hypothetical protein
MRSPVATCRRNMAARRAQAAAWAGVAPHPGRASSRDGRTIKEASRRRRQIGDRFMGFRNGFGKLLKLKCRRSGEIGIGSRLKTGNLFFLSASKLFHIFLNL